MFKQGGGTYTLIIFLLIWATGVSAQDVVMNSAETINPGNFKLGIFPVVLLGQDGGDAVWGAAGRAGLGIHRRIDIEVKGALLKNITYFGFDVEFWFIHGQNINASLTLGGHMTNHKTGADSYGLDTVLLISTAPFRNLEIYGGFKLAFDSVKDSDQTFTMMHIVPGIEYRLSRKIDFLTEFGIALNNDSRSYISMGFSYYFKR